MRILFTNDDGYDLQGLHAVADLYKSDCQIAVIAPDMQKSGFSHSLTLKPCTLSYKKVEGYGYPVYAVGGTPVDCVKAACNFLFKAPDLVVSGINRGRNLGSDIMYSGTVSAAFEAAHSGYRAIALSLNTDVDDVKAYAEFARFFKANLDKFLGLGLPENTILNINYPAVSPRGIRIARVNAKETYVDCYSNVDSGVLVPSGKRNYDVVLPNTDEDYCLAGYITITPITIDRTDYKSLEQIKDMRFDL